MSATKPTCGETLMGTVPARACGRPAKAYIPGETRGAPDRPVCGIHARAAKAWGQRVVTLGSTATDRLR